MKVASVFLLALLLFQSSPAQTHDPRAESLARLAKQGFQVSPGLPSLVDEQRSLRPQAEIEARLQALYALVMWVAGPGDQAALRERALRGDLSSWVTTEERQIFLLSKEQAKEQHLDSVGWQMENMWALAWVLGYEHPLPFRGILEGDLARDLVFQFCPKSDKKTRKLAEVIAQEDLFYCAHNAIRSAQLGGQTVPPDYDPMLDGRAVQERRHGLSWCLSPGVDWEKTDLST